MRVSGVVPERLSGGDDSSENSSESSCYEVMDTNGEIVHMAKRLTCRVEVSFFLFGAFNREMFFEDEADDRRRTSTLKLHLVSRLQVRIREATGLPLNLSNFVFCQYTFWEHGEPAVAPPMVSPDRPSPRSPDAQFTVQFDHCKVSENGELLFVNALTCSVNQNLKFLQLLFVFNSTANHFSSCRTMLCM